MTEATMTIGQVAQRAGINTSAIRYYERCGVLPEPVRVSGQRRYDDDTLARLRIIDVAQHAAFSLDEIKVLLAHTDTGEPAHRQLQELAARKLPDIDALIERARLIRAWLDTAAGCGCDTLDVCALFSDQADQTITELPILQIVARGSASSPHTV
jgi:MerR family redox-sensitive transcriptional activator SoxR